MIKKISYSEENTLINRWVFGMVLSVGGFPTRRERGGAESRVWACSLRSRGRPLRSVSGWAGLTVSQENCLVGAGEPAGGSASHPHGRNRSVWPLPGRWSHKQTRQFRPSAAPARKVWQRGRGFRLSAYASSCHSARGFIWFLLFYIRSSSVFPPWLRGWPS